LLQINQFFTTFIQLEKYIHHQLICFLLIAKDMFQTSHRYYFTFLWVLKSRPVLILKELFKLGIQKMVFYLLALSESYQLFFQCRLSFIFAL